MESRSAAPAVSGGFAFSFRRQRNSSSASSSRLGIWHASPAPVSSPPVRRKPLPENATPIIFPRWSQRNSISLSQPQTGSEDQPAEAGFLISRDLDRYPRGQSPFLPFLTDTSKRNQDPEKDGKRYVANGVSSHSRLASDPLIPALRPPPPHHKRSETMTLQLERRPPPLTFNNGLRIMTNSGSMDLKQPKTPGSKITSFFGWKTVSSPGAESSSTEISDTGRSPLPSPLPPPYPNPSLGTKPAPTAPDGLAGNPLPFPVRAGSLGAIFLDPDLGSKVSQLENELRGISSELAGSIRREMELEDLVEKFQLEAHSNVSRRTSDYFSDSGIGSVKTGLDTGGRIEDIERIKRVAEQERARLKVELSQKWQDERSRRTAFESHVHLLENQVQQFHRERVDASNLISKTKELEVTLEDTRRKLTEERQSKDNFEDLVTAMRVELEQLRNERDHLQQEVIPQLQAQQRTRFNIIAEEDGNSTQRGSMVGLSRSNSLARMPLRATGVRSGSLSRSDSVSAKDRESRETLAERVRDVEAQRDALHQALRSLLGRQAYQARQYEKRVGILETELDRVNHSSSPRKPGYEREVRNLREEINHLRRRADDALVQKWQCEKGLSGLKMDLDRAEQETSSLRALLQEHDIALPHHLVATEEELEGLANVQATSASLEAAYQQLQADIEYAEANSSRSLEEEQKLADQLSASVSRTEALAGQVKHQLDTNSSLRTRLAEAISKGEREQQRSTSRINDLQDRLRGLEDTLMLAQHYSEEEMAKHEEEIRALKESHNAQLMRAWNGIKSPILLSPRPPASPFSISRTPRLDKTSSGDGMPLSQVVQSQELEARVKELEKALHDADLEMEEVVGRMNKAQIEVAELQTDRDEALRRTRRLQAEIVAERERFKVLMG